MALIKMTAFVADIRGKVNGTVFSKNRGGAYVRTKVTPSNPQTIAQNAVRAVLSGFSQGWRALTSAQRAAWNAAVSNFPVNNVFGDSKLLSGHQLYVRLNSQLAAAGQSAITSPPVPTGADAMSALSGAASVGGGTFTATFGPDPVPTDHTLIIEASPQVSPGKSNVNSLYRQINTEAAAASSPSDIFSAYTAKFGALVEGQKVGLRAKLVRNSTGEVSSPITAEVIIAA